MTTEPQRLQYLEAMGLTAWVGRYRLSNALPTPECEWELPEPAPAVTPSARLHDLLEQPGQARLPEVSDEPRTAARQPGRARALLGDMQEVPETASPERPSKTEKAVPGSVPDTTADEPQQALRFTLQIGALDARWLVMVPGETPPRGVAVRLLENLLRAAGIEPSRALEYQTFRWPMMDELPVEAPLEEARDGLRAFLAGRRGWQPERLLVFGSSDELSRILAVEEGRASLLALPVWWGPALEQLAEDPAAKRELLGQLPCWRDAWRSDGDVSGDA